MLKVNSVYKHGRHENLRLEGLYVKSNMKVSAMQDSWMCEEREREREREREYNMISETAQT